MPYSSYNGKQVINHFIKQHPEIKSAVDFGAGAGWYGKKIRTIHPGMRLTAIEGYAPNIEKFELRKIYDEVIEGNFEHLAWPEADLAIFGDVLEHLEKETAIKMILFAGVV